LRQRLEQLKAQREQQEASQRTGGRNSGGGWTPGGVDAHQVRSGRRGNR
jgi:hypothetical protein